ncbi:hypothetical protein LZ906_003290 [Paraclostridium ghonii]|uniref:hypothetical protein n=1 Tax=Paraclostridium ghonii TaxID=29358 RepID=UPI00202CDCC3|nr:hypothetical protein [Paeniclostridium ghonii]
MNSLLFILGMIALSNGNISLSDNKDSSIDINEEFGSMRSNLHKKNNKLKLKSKSRPKNIEEEDIEEDDEEDFIDETEYIDPMSSFNINDIDKGIKMLELSDDDLDRGLEIITRTKKYMDKDEKKVLIKIESVLDLVRGIKKLSNVDLIDDEDESDFFRSMEEEDKKNMMIKEIIEVFPESKKESVEKAIDMKKKIELFAELFLPDDIGEENSSGFSLSSLASINNIGSLNNLKLLGSLLRNDNKQNNYAKSNKYNYVNEDEEKNEEEDFKEILDEKETDNYAVDDYIDYDYVRIDK